MGTTCTCSPKVSQPSSTIITHSVSKIPIPTVEVIKRVPHKRVLLLTGQILEAYDFETRQNYSYQLKKGYSNIRNSEIHQEENTQSRISISPKRPQRPFSQFIHNPDREPLPSKDSCSIVSPNQTIPFNTEITEIEGKIFLTGGTRDFINSVSTTIEIPETSVHLIEYVSDRENKDGKFNDNDPTALVQQSKHMTLGLYWKEVDSLQHPREYHCAIRYCNFELNQKFIYAVGGMNSLSFLENINNFLSGPKAINKGITMKRPSVYLRKDTIHSSKNHKTHTAIANNSTQFSDKSDTTRNTKEEIYKSNNYLFPKINDSQSQMSNFNILSQCEKYDIYLDKWETIGCLVQPRYKSSGAVLKHYLYIFGGINRRAIVLKEIERMDLNEDDLGFKTLLLTNYHSEWIGFYSMGCLQVGEAAILLFGGYSSLNLFSKNSFTFYSNENKISANDKLEESDTFDKQKPAIYNNNYVYAIGNKFKHLHVFDLSKNSWSNILPKDWRNVEQIVCENREEEKETLTNEANIIDSIKLEFAPQGSSPLIENNQIEEDKITT